VKLTQKQHYLLTTLMFIIVLTFFANGLIFIQNKFLQWWGLIKQTP